jgi:hypothetical protein
MDIATLLALILQHGLPAALEIGALFKDRAPTDPVTEADWARLEALAAKTYTDYAPPIPPE